MEKPVGTGIVGVATPDDVRARELRSARASGSGLDVMARRRPHLARLALIGRWWKE